MGENARKFHDRPPAGGGKILPDSWPRGHQKALGEAWKRPEAIGGCIGAPAEIVFPAQMPVNHTPRQGEPEVADAALVEVLTAARQGHNGSFATWRTRV